MNRIFSKKEWCSYGICFLSGVILFIWSSWRNSACGYDCGLFAVNSGPVVIVSWLFSFVLIGASLGLMFIVFIKRKYSDGK